jgi:hypothetical protein
VVEHSRGQVETIELGQAALGGGERECHSRRITVRNGSMTNRLSLSRVHHQAAMRAAGMEPLSRSWACSSNRNLDPCRFRSGRRIPAPTAAIWHDDQAACTSGADCWPATAGSLGIDHRTAGPLLARVLFTRRQE